jgi:hypothetical protein
MRSGAEILGVVIVGEFCPFCRMDATQDRIRAVLGEAAELADAEGAKFVAIGVAIDPEPSTGLRFLEALYPFDEVAAGRNWSGIGSLRYIWNDFPGEAAVPQLLLLRREIEIDTIPFTVRVTGEHVVARVVGVTSLQGFDVARALAGAAPQPEP